MEYIITEKTEKHGWCLWVVCGKDEEWALQVLMRERAKYPEKELRVESIPSEDAWWNDPFLCN
jgi:hypothetical protein